MFCHGDETACQFMAPPEVQLTPQTEFVRFVKETLAALPQKVEKVFFRADSGFFNGGLFNLLNGKHEYLVKVKLKNLKDLLAGQTWQPIGPRTATCQFTHQCSGWRNPHVLCRACRKANG